MIHGLGERGIDLGDGDLIVGTSGGARTAVQLATGALEQVADRHRRGEAPPARAPVPLDAFTVADTGILAEAHAAPTSRPATTW